MHRLHRQPRRLSQHRGAEMPGRPGTEGAHRDLRLRRDAGRWRMTMRPAPGDVVPVRVAAGERVT